MESLSGARLSAPRTDVLDWHLPRHLDYMLILATAGLIAYGVTMIYFATRHDIDGAPLYFVRQQLIAVARRARRRRSSPRCSTTRSTAASSGCCTLSRSFILVAVLPLGEVVNGARRWIDLGFTSFQPSAAGAAPARARASARSSPTAWTCWARKRVTLIALALVAVPAFLVYQEPDFGSAMVMVVLTLAMLYFYGTSWTHFAVLAAAGSRRFVVALKVLPLAGIHLIQQYQIDRLFVFLNAGAATRTRSGYNIIQSMIAVGSGALTGRGDMATQTTLDFLPEHHTDFIFAVISERNGFLGASSCSCSTLCDLACLRIATLSRDMYGSILAGGIGVMLPVPGVREHRHDDWYHAGDGHPVAVRQLRRHGHDRVPDVRRPAAGHPPAGHGHAEHEGAPCPVA